MTREVLRQAQNDKEGTCDYTVTPNNIHLISSFKVRKKDFEKVLVKMRKRHPESQVWKRSIQSLKWEWAAHNAFHALGIARKNTAHADLNWPQHWLIRVGYELLGRIAWPFIK